MPTTAPPPCSATPSISCSGWRSGRAARIRPRHCRRCAWSTIPAGLIRAPEVRFSSQEIGLDQFGYNIENRALMVALEERAAELSEPRPVRRRG
jgi:hypothetical protein